MSTRYVWEVYSPAVTKYIDAIDHDPNQPGSGMGLDMESIPLNQVWNYSLGMGYIMAGNDYTFDENTGLYTLTNTSNMGNNVNGYDYPNGGITVCYWDVSGTQILYRCCYVLSLDRKTLYTARPNEIKKFFAQTYKNPGDRVWWGIVSGTLRLLWYDESQNSPTISGHISRILIGHRNAINASVGEQFKYYKTTSTNSAPSGGSYSVRSKGTNNIQPTKVTISKNDKRVVTVQITGTSGISNLTGQSLKYYVQYQINGGTWQDYNSGNAYDFTYNSSSKTITTIAQSDDVETIRFRVRAIDGLGYTSDWVQSSVLDMQTLKAYIGVNGKARKGVKLYVGINGKARKVTAAYIGGNSKARRVL